MATSSYSRHLENMCRLCLTDASDAGCMVPIFPVRGGNPHSSTAMVHRLFQCTSLKLEQKEGIPDSICELCMVRIEDWVFFREQCIGAEEFFRTVPGNVYAADESYVSSKATGQQKRLTTTISSVGEGGSSRAAASSTTTTTTTVHPASRVSSDRFSSLAKRRKSMFEWTIGDGKGNSTNQKLIVEVLGGDDGAVERQGDLERRRLPQSVGGNQPSYEPIPFCDRNDESSAAAGPRVTATADVAGRLEEATWSKEYCARVNSLMVLVNGPRPFKCKICRKLFKSRSNLRRHIKVNHSDEVFEGESPPPECYDFGHIHRAGGGGAIAGGAGTTHYSASQSVGGQPFSTSGQQQQKMMGQNSNGPLKRKRKSTDPPITGPYKCHVCPRSFKMAAHLAVHMKTHSKVQETAAPTGLEQQFQQQLLQHQQQREVVSNSRRSSVVSRKTDIESNDIIQLSDDDEDEIEMDVKQGDDDTSYAVNSAHGDELDDDGFDEEEGSFKEGASFNDTSGELRGDNRALRTSSFSSPPAMIERRKSIAKEEDDVVLVIPEDDATPDVAPTETAAKSRRMPAPGTIPPGPLSMKQRYRDSLENGTSLTGKQSPSAQSQFPFIVARPKHSPVTVATPSFTPPPPPVPAVIVEMGMADPQPESPSPPATANANVHRCHFCQQTFAREDQLRVHQKIHQRDAPFPFRCRWCQRGFRYRQNYTVHVEKRTCRLLHGEAGGGGGGSVDTLMPAGKPMLAAATPMVAARPIVANKRAW